MAASAKALVSARVSTRVAQPARSRQAILTISRVRCRRNAAMNPARSGTPATAACTRCSISPCARPRWICAWSTNQVARPTSRARLMVTKSLAVSTRGRASRRAGDAASNTAKAPASRTRVSCSSPRAANCGFIRRADYSNPDGEKPLAPGVRRPRIEAMNTRQSALLLATSWACLAACSRHEQVREIDWARDALARNPQYEILATDDQAGVFTLRDTTTGAMRTVRLKELVAAPLPTAAAPLPTAAATPPPAAPEAPAPEPQASAESAPAGVEADDTL